MTLAGAHRGLRSAFNYCIFYGHLLRYPYCRNNGWPSWFPDIQPAGPAGAASVAKRSKAPVCGTGDHGFESRRSPQNTGRRHSVKLHAAPVAQWIEHWASDPGVAGSTPAGRAIPPLQTNDYRSGKPVGSNRRISPWVPASKPGYETWSESDIAPGPTRTLVEGVATWLNAYVWA